MKSEEIFRDKPVWAAIFSMAVPAVITILVMVFYNMADMFFVAQLGDTSQVAAVSVVGPLFSLAAAFATMLGAGGCAAIARVLGAGDYEKAKIYSSLCVWSALIGGLLLGAVILAFEKPILYFLGATPQVWDYALTYLRILALGVPFMLSSFSLATIVRSEGAIKEGLAGNMLGTVINIVLDPIFILVLGMGIGGAALATVLGNLAGSCFFLYHIKRRAAVLTIDHRYALKAPAAIGHILALGLPNAVSSVLSGMASTFSNQLLSGYGTEAIAAMAGAGKTTLVITMVQMGICMGVQPMLAYNHGAGNVARTKETLKKLGILTCSLGLTAAVGCYAGRHALLGLFLKEEAVAQLGERLVFFLVLASPFIGLYYLSVNFLQAAGKALTATLVSVLRQGVLLIPCLYISNRIWGLVGIGIAHLLADIGAIALALLLFGIHYRRL